jgi:GAF domain-containing protein
MERKYERDRDDLAALLKEGGVHGVLRAINANTAFRFTGVYRFEGETLCNVALFDRWDPQLETGADAPLAETYCAITGRLDSPLEVQDGSSDSRFPWMQQNAVLSYCGVPIHDADNRPIGTLCHFDLQPCQAPSTEFERLGAFSSLLYECVARSHLSTAAQGGGPPA